MYYLKYDIKQPLELKSKLQMLKIGLRINLNGKPRPQN